jgi:3-hydroxyisobutyrate dehydrogenase-like beta-hydroxyacid dehydrogenase
MFETPAAETRVGFVGLGTMGLPMATNLTADDVTVHGYDVDEDAVRKLEDAGGIREDAVTDLGASCRIVSVVVKTAAQVRSVLTGRDGVFTAMEESGGIVLIHSTIHPEACQSLSDEAPDGVVVLDAPMSGAHIRAETGELAFMVGGEEWAYEYCRPLFDRMGEHSYHLGPVGNGEVVKIANNLVGLSNIMTTAEGIALGTEWGIERDKLLEVMSESSANNFMLENWEWVVEEWDESQPGGFEAVAEICAKDLSLSLELASDRSLPVPGSAVASQQVPAFFMELADRE